MTKTFQEEFAVSIRGTAPLLMHRFVSGSKEEDESPATEKRGRTRHDPKEEAIATQYKTEENKLYQPAEHFEACWTKEAVNYKIPGQGKKTFKDAVKASVFVDPRQIVHKIQKWVIDEQAVIINRARIMRARTRLDKWELDFVVQNIDERITPSVLEQIITNAGRFVGIGDYRPKYGRYEVIKFEKIR